MNKIFLIIRREYLTRVRKRTFIISTLLFPLLYIGVIFGTAYIGANNKTRLHIAVLDNSGYFDKGRFERSNQLDSSTLLTLVQTSKDSLLAIYKNQGYEGFIIIPAIPDWRTGISDLPLQTSKAFGSSTTDQVQAKLNSIWTDIKNEKSGIDENTKNIISSSRITVKSVNDLGKETNQKAASGIGFAAGFLIYLILLIYGSQTMMGVMEEKTNRIAEVIVSSVKPFQLMLGKIIGIGLVALTQFLLWVTFVFLIYNVTKASAAGGGMMNGVVGSLQGAFANINLVFILCCFAFYFLAGFFFYSSLYAAIGSAVNEDMREAQSLSFPITMIVIFSIALMSQVISDPTGPIAVWGSIIPFSSPILMMARIPFGVPGTVPIWQLALSMGLLIIGFIFTVWLSGKIYRTGILMYGKKPSWKELIKWAFRKN